MTRSVRLLAGWGVHGLGLARIEILTHADNHRSVAVAQRAGARREGLVCGYRENGGERQDRLVFSQLHEDL